MKITFLVNHDIAALLALNYLIPSLAQHDIQVLYSNKRSQLQNEPKALACLKKFDAKLVAQSTGLTSFTELGARQANDVNKGDFQLLESHRPNLIVSIRYMTILQQDCIDLASDGVINLHSGALPNYQGVMASFWAMLHGQPQLATSLHRIDDAKIDSGQIIARSTVQTNYEKSYLWNVLNLYRGGCETVIAAIESLSKYGAIEATAQTGQPRYFSFPKQTDIDQATFKLFSSSDSATSFAV